MEVVRTKKGPHKIYRNHRDFVDNGGDASKVIAWMDTKDDVQAIKMRTHLELSSGEVIPILGLRKLFRSIGIETPFGVYLTGRSRSTLPNWVFDFELDMRRFVDLIVDTRNFFFAFMVAFPEKYVEFDGDNIKILNWSYKTNILYKGFFKELRGRMQEQEILDMIGASLPVEKARKAIEEILDDSEVEAKVRGDIAMKTIQEFNKVATEMRAELRRKRDPLKEVSSNNPFILPEEKHGD